MKHTEIVGYAADAENYCVEHAPADTSRPIFAGDESWNDDDCPECRTLPPERPRFTAGFTPLDVLARHVRRHCGERPYPMRIVDRLERRALELSGHPCDGGGNLSVPSGELVALLERLNALTWTTEISASAAEQLRSSILETLGIEEV